MEESKSIDLGHTLNLTPKTSNPGSQRNLSAKSRDTEMKLKKTDQENPTNDDEQPSSLDSLKLADRPNPSEPRIQKIDLDSIEKPMIYNPPAPTKLKHNQIDWDYSSVTEDHDYNNSDNDSLVLDYGEPTNPPFPFPSDEPIPKTNPNTISDQIATRSPKNRNKKLVEKFDQNFLA